MTPKRNLDATGAPPQPAPKRLDFSAGEGSAGGSDGPRKRPGSSVPRPVAEGAAAARVPPTLPLAHPAFRVLGVARGRLLGVHPEARRYHVQPGCPKEVTLRLRLHDFCPLSSIQREELA